MSVQEENKTNFNKNLESLKEACADENTIATYAAINQTLENISINAPPGGYGPLLVKKFKKKFFKPKTNWGMLSTLVGLAAFVAMAMIYLHGV